ncbi:MAG: hypothetical protein JW793_14700 [Acidobacteria bacterium]|nr:hypothetical protein [Acidobacteriota bacterium]
MKRLFEIVLAALLPLGVTLAFAGTPAQAADEAEEPVHRFLNPQGIPGPVEVRGLAPRLDTIKGKTIYIAVCEAGPQTGPFLEQYLKDTYPDTHWVRIQHNGFGPTNPAEDGELLAKADAVIGGQSW